ncbi:MAG: hypothetical protein OXI17_07525 [Gammaproteobacteria bacterium]|nr:hypothetical protein [Gammaproteobacteria bacterium]MDE0480403.1 hypothetical protein [Gammaproteobacteria bacterium]MDE0508471.1 hypothetical protein [Gammaproteobacteria bacterium]
MITEFPSLPDFGFSWRSLQVEPVRMSGERITLAAILKADEGALLVPRFVSWEKLKSLYGETYGRELEKALSICLSRAEEHYSTSPIFADWLPPIEGFYLGDPKHSLASDITEAVLVAGRHCSSISLASQSEEPSSGPIKAVSAHEKWTSRIIQDVGEQCSWVANCFNAKVDLKAAHMQIKIGLLTEHYAAQFEAVASPAAIPKALLRAQAKLWQLDLLREGEFLFKPESCELLLGIPQPEDGSVHGKIREFVEEIEYEAKKKHLGVFATSSATDAARHVIEKAAA